MPCWRTLPVRCARPPHGTTRRLCRSNEPSRASCAGSSSHSYGPDSIPSTTRCPMDTQSLLGLRSGIYHVADLASAKEWYTQVLGKPPYFDEPFYVGFDVGGYELGLNPDTSRIRPGHGGGVIYWGVAHADEAYQRLISLGAKPIETVTHVVGGIPVLL